MRIISIIQARTGSTRLPGKVLMDLAGEPMLVRVFNRTKRAEKIDEVVIATTSKTADAPIVELCQKNGWPYFCGSEQDVLDRYYKAASAFDADVVVRITSDCPIIDPKLIDRHVNAMLNKWREVDFVSNMLYETFPLGLAVEVMPFDILSRLNRLSKTKKLREHVTTLIYQKPEYFIIDHVINDINLSHMRWTVDTLEDLKLIRCVYDYFCHDQFDWSDVLHLLRKRPDLKNINRHIKQKAV